MPIRSPVRVPRSASAVRINRTPSVIICHLLSLINEKNNKSYSVPLIPYAPVYQTVTQAVCHCALSLTIKLLDAVIHLAWDQREWHNTGNVHFWAENVHAEIQLLADCLDVLETFLVVGTGTADPDLDLVLVEEGSDFAEGADDTLECAGDLESKSVIVTGSRFRWKLTLVKLAIPPPINRTLPSGCCGARSIRSKTVRA